MTQTGAVSSLCTIPSPHAITVNKDGIVYVQTATSVYEVSESGKSIKSILSSRKTQSTSWSQYGNGITVNSNGTVYCAFTEVGLLATYKETRLFRGNFSKAIAPSDNLLEWLKTLNLEDMHPVLRKNLLLL